MIHQLVEAVTKAIKPKYPGKLSKGVLFQQENAEAHKSLFRMSAITYASDFELVARPLHYAGLAQSNNHLFLNMKIFDWEPVTQ